MVAEPSHNEVNPPTSKDDLHNNQLPHREEDLASDDAAQRVAPSGRNGSSALSSSSVFHGNPSRSGSPRSTSSSRNQHTSPHRAASPDGDEDSRGGSPTGSVVFKQELDPAPHQMTGARPKREHPSPHRRSSSAQKVLAPEDDVDDICSTAAGVGVLGHGEEGKGAKLRRNSGGSNTSRGSGGRPSGGETWSRGATLPDLSEFERVWEAAPEVIIKPASLASSETLTPTDAYTPPHTLDSLGDNQSVSTDDPSAFIKTQGKPQQDVGEEWMLPQQEEEDLVGAVGGVGHACGCGVRVGVLDEASGRCPACPPPADVYVSEQFPSSDPLECLDGSTHTLHVDLSTGEVQLHVHMSDPEKLPGGPPTEPAKCLDDPAFRPTPTTSAEADPNPPKKAISFVSLSFCFDPVPHALYTLKTRAWFIHDVTSVLHSFRGNSLLAYHRHHYLHITTTGTSERISIDTITVFMTVSSIRFTLNDCQQYSHLVARLSIVLTFC